MYQPVGKTLFPLLVVEPSEHVKGAPARQAAADRELRDKLIAATGGNVIRGPGIDDVSPIRAAMEVIPVERILSAIRCKTDNKLYPRNEPATSWREDRPRRRRRQSDGRLPWRPVIGVLRTFPAVLRLSWRKAAHLQSTRDRKYYCISCERHGARNRIPGPLASAI
jgi:hypothetical protein